MFGFLSGKIKIIRSDHIILENLGMGFAIYLPKNLLKDLMIEQNFQLLIETKIKNSEQIMLFGFQTEFQRIFFNHLCSISGVSDKLALSICSLFSPKDLLDYCLQNKTKLEFKIEGMGPKTWEKILFYLGRNKNLQTICMEFISLNPEISKEKLDVFSEAKMALVSLGIDHSSAQKLIENISSSKQNKSMTLEDIIKEALNSYQN